MFPLQSAQGCGPSGSEEEGREGESSHICLYYIFSVGAGLIFY